MRLTWCMCINYVYTLHMNPSSVSLIDTWPWNDQLLWIQLLFVFLSCSIQTYEKLSIRGLQGRIFGCLLPGPVEECSAQWGTCGQRLGNHLAQELTCRWGSSSEWAPARHLSTGISSPLEAAMLLKASPCSCVYSQERHEPDTRDNSFTHCFKQSRNTGTDCIYICIASNQPSSKVITALLCWCLEHCQPGSTGVIAITAFCLIII